MNDSEAQFAALRAQLQDGLKLARQSSYQRRMPNKEALPELRAALAGLRSLAPELTTAEFWRTLALAEEVVLHYPAAIAALEKAIAASPQPDRKDLKRMVQLKEYGANWEALGLTPEALEELGRFLREKLQLEPCDHSQRHTEAWLAQRGTGARAKTIKAIESCGGYCDCEVLANVV